MLAGRARDHGSLSLPALSSRRLPERQALLPAHCCNAKSSVPQPDPTTHLVCIADADREPRGPAAGAATACS